ncbi:dethiobiotin synthase [Mucilaginibacter corticis]|uniref:ATP-dependent dethiobiotin synthetase BioD n=1 Tax=Mucilaginibacter corticis TaxID=2597670 RepID=A0A556MH72_9SPHI|nr:dethiobiotin synthase [Mucilaginibacter corticis]TSJ39271.1 dethiobiotin synthase [Mucilaginibacter corticis]
MSNKPLFITGIDTGIGKTIVSAILVESLQADYWKPVQSGDLDNSDTLKVKSLVSNSKTTFHPETYRLTQPYSPHKSAALDGIVIDPEKFSIPVTDNQLLIEGAGGLMVPLNNDFLMIDLIKQLNADVILVVKHYLGSINHTLLSLDALNNRNIPVKAIIFNGDGDEYSEDIITKYANCKTIHIPQIKDISKENIAAEKVSL